MGIPKGRICQFQTHERKIKGSIYYREGLWGLHDFDGVNGHIIVTYSGL